MKKVFALILALVMLLSVVACGSKTTETTAPKTETKTETKVETKTETKAEAKVYKVAMICDSSISDGGWGAACYNAMIDAAKINGWETAYSDMID